MGARRRRGAGLRGMAGAMTWRAAGFRAWLWQRVTAAYMAVFVVFFAIAAIVKQPDTYSEWKGWIGDGRMAVALGLFFAAMLLHSWVGVRDVLIDYVRPLPLRLSLLALVALGLFAVGMWIFRSLLLATL